MCVVVSFMPAIYLKLKSFDRSNFLLCSVSNQFCVLFLLLLLLCALDFDGNVHIGSDDECVNNVDYGRTRTSGNMSATISFFVVHIAWWNLSVVRCSKQIFYYIFYAKGSWDAHGKRMLALNRQVDWLAGGWVNTPVHTCTKRVMLQTELSLTCNEAWSSGRLRIWMRRISVNVLSGEWMENDVRFSMKSEKWICGKYPQQSDTVRHYTWANPVYDMQRMHWKWSR